MIRLPKPKPAVVYDAPPGRPAPDAMRAQVLALVMLLGRFIVSPDEDSLRMFVGRDWRWAELEARARGLLNPAKMALSTEGEALYWAGLTRRYEAQRAASKGSAA